MVDCRSLKLQKVKPQIRGEPLYIFVCMYTSMKEAVETQRGAVGEVEEGFPVGDLAGRRRLVQPSHSPESPDGET